METETEAKTRLEFTPPAAGTDVAAGSTEHEQKRHTSQEMERRSVQFTDAVWSDSESQSSKRRSEAAATESENANGEKTRRMEQLTMSTPERSDGTKTPLRKPGQKRRERSRSRMTDYTVEADEMAGDSAEELQQLVLEERTRTRQELRKSSMHSHM